VRAAWVVPKKNKSILVERPEKHSYREGAQPLVDIGPVPMPPLAPHLLDIAEDRLVYAENSGVVIARGLASKSPALTRIKLPAGTDIHALTEIDGVVYVGGSGTGEMLGLIDIRREPRFQPVDVPKKIITHGKGVDGFAHFNGKLIAVDDFILPRFLLVYDVADARAPRFVEAVDLPAHSTYERVKSVAASDRALTLLSTTANHGRFFVHVSLLDLATLKERAVVHGEPEGVFRAGISPTADFSRVAIYEDRLLIAAGSAGIGVLPISPWLTPGEDVREIPFDDIRFVPVGKERVVGVVPVDASTAFAITETKGGFFRRSEIDSSLVEIP
jgi:hypothetical protein